MYGYLAHSRYSISFVECKKYIWKHELWNQDLSLDSKKIIDIASGHNPIKQDSCTNVYWRVIAINWKQSNRAIIRELEYKWYIHEELLCKSLSYIYNNFKEHTQMLMI